MKRTMASWRVIAIGMGGERDERIVQASYYWPALMKAKRLRQWHKLGIEQQSVQATEISEARSGRANVPEGPRCRNKTP